MSEYDWDDTALLQAYDAAVRGGGGEAPTKRTPNNKRAKPSPAPPPAAPHLDQIQDEKLAALLQAYFSAGFALGQYLKS